MYIAVSDLRARHIKSFPTEVLQPFVNETNDWLDDYARGLGVEPAEIVVPIKPILRSFLVAHAQMEFCNAYIGADGTATSGETSVYEQLYTYNADQFKIHKPRITADLLRQQVNSVKTGAVRFGRIVR